MATKICPLIVFAALTLTACGDDPASVRVAAEAPATTLLAGPSTSGDTRTPEEIAAEAEAPVWEDSIRSSLRGENASVIATVQKVDGSRLTVVVDEVLSIAMHAEQYPDSCVDLRPGTPLEIDNKTVRFENELAVGDRALFVGETCDEYADGRLSLVRNGPNGRRVADDGTIDLGAGDVATIDEVRGLAGETWAASIPPVTEPLTATVVERSGSELQLKLSGSSDARIGVTFCRPGMAAYDSPVQDYMGRCALQFATDAPEPVRVVGESIRLTYTVPDDLRGAAFDVVVFGESADGSFHVLAITPSKA